MRIIINQDRSVEIRENYGTNTENLSETIEVIAPKIIRNKSVYDYNAYLVLDIEEPNNRIPINIDEIYEVNNKIAKLEFVNACITFVEKSAEINIADKIIFSTKPFSLSFDKTIKMKEDMEETPIIEDILNSLLTRIENTNNSLKNYVEKEEGKSLFSSKEKGKLENIEENAQVNVLENISVNDVKQEVGANKTINLTIPTKMSELTNDDNTVKDDNYTHTDNNFTDENDTKLENIEKNAQVNKIEKISINNIEQEIDKHKKVNIQVPTKMSELDNDDNVVKDSNYKHIIIDSELDRNSTNPLENKTIFSELNKKLNSSIANVFFKDIQYNASTGIFTFIKYDNTQITIDLPIESAVKSGRYDATTHKLILVLMSDDTIEIPIADLVDVYTGNTNTQIQVVVKSGNIIEAILRKGSITEEYLDNALVEKVNENRNIAFATFDIDLDTGELIMYTNKKTDLEFRLSQETGNMEVLI